MRRRYLTVASSLGATALIAGGAYLLAMRLWTAPPVEDGAVVELDVSGVELGGLRAFPTWEGEFWVVHRTPEQIALLERRPRQSAPDPARGLESSPLQASRLRSADPAYFVFRVQRIGDGIMLRQYPERYLVCSDLRLFRGERSYPGGYVITDGLSCADDPQVAYDLAGLPSSPYFTALEVPEHEVRRGTVIVRAGP